MTLGISTYAYLWRSSDRMPRPLSLWGILSDVQRLGLQVLQICDFPVIEKMDATALERLHADAAARQITLELGTKGVEVERLRRYLVLAQRLDARLVRTVFGSATHQPTPREAEANLRCVLPEYEETGVVLALETYEQVPTRTVLDVVERVDSPNLGICLDPGNVVAALEDPRALAEMVAHRVVNLHIKDFAFTRKDDWVGFTLSGCPLGEGLLDYEHLVRTVRPDERGITQVIEQWLPWLGDPETTARLEDEWVEHAVRYMEEMNDR